MHELSYMIRFVEMAKEAIADTPEAKIKTITVEVGQLTGVLPEYLEKYFPDVIKETPYKDASLKVISVPVEAECSSCGTTYKPNKDNNYSCPACHSIDAKIIKGRELNLLHVEVSL